MCGLPCSRPLRSLLVIVPALGLVIAGVAPTTARAEPSAGPATAQAQAQPQPQSIGPAPVPPPLDSTIADPPVLEATPGAAVPSNATPATIPDTTTAPPPAPLPPAPPMMTAPAASPSAAPAFAPSTAAAHPSDSPPIFERWWFWTAIAAVGVTAVVIIASSGPTAPKTDLPTMVAF